MVVAVARDEKRTQGSREALQAMSDEAWQQVRKSSQTVGQMRPNAESTELVGGEDV